MKILCIILNIRDTHHWNNLNCLNWKNTLPDNIYHGIHSAFNIIWIHISTHKCRAYLQIIIQWTSDPQIYCPDSVTSSMTYLTFTSDLRRRCVWSNNAEDWAVLPVSVGFWSGPACVVNSEISSEKACNGQTEWQLNRWQAEASVCSLETSLWFINFISSWSEWVDRRSVHEECM